MNEKDSEMFFTVESFMRSLAEQLAHQMGGKVEDFQLFQKQEEEAEGKSSSTF